MKFRTGLLAASLLLPVASGCVAAAQNAGVQHGEASAASQRNVIVFVADGMRHGSVNETDAPTMLWMRRHGVHFVNSHSLFPTFTTANASAIATGHMLGDTGDYSNTIDSGFLTQTSNGERTVTPFVEDDRVLRDLDDHYAGNWLHEDSLIGLARKQGYNTAVIGKLGPVGVQDVAELTTGVAPATVFVDDQTGSASGIPLRPDVASAMSAEGLPLVAPNRSNDCAPKSRCDNGYSGTGLVPGTNVANVGQQRYLQQALTTTVLPLFEKQGKPFAILFWSRDPDGTQHNQGDSLNNVEIGINGPTSKAAVHNADNNLYAIVNWLNAHPEIARNTDIFLTADHGYATISRSVVDAAGTRTRSYAAGFDYKATTGAPEIPHGFLPSGFLAIDLAHALNLPLYDPDTETSDGSHYVHVDPSGAIPESRQHPLQGSALIGGSGTVPADAKRAPDADVIVAANGGSDLIYVPSRKSALVQHVAEFLLRQDYTGGIFVDDTLGPVAGTLPMSAAGLQGSALVPRPTIVISFKTFYTVPAGAPDRLMHAVQIADTGLQQGQGMHGSFGRDNTYNNMAAIGPDFREGFEDPLPVSNADITPTLAAVLHLQQEPQGKLQGRVLTEALKGGPAAPLPERSVLAGPKAPDGTRTVLFYQRLGTATYFDTACLARGSGPIRADQPCQD